MKIYVRFSFIIRRRGAFNFSWWDYLINGIGLVGTFFSLIGAYKANVYYKKSKQLTIYANTNIAFME